MKYCVMIEGILNFRIKLALFLVNFRLVPQVTKTQVNTDSSQSIMTFRKKNKKNQS